MVTPRLMVVTAAVPAHSSCACGRLRRKSNTPMAIPVYMRQRRSTCLVSVCVCPCSSVILPFSSRVIKRRQYRDIVASWKEQATTRREGSGGADRYDKTIRKNSQSTLFLPAPGPAKTATFASVLAIKKRPPQHATFSAKALSSTRTNDRWARLLAVVGQDGR